MALRDGAAAGAVGFAACAILAAALLGLASLVHARADKVRLAATIFPLHDMAVIAAVSALVAVVLVRRGPALVFAAFDPEGDVPSGPAIVITAGLAFLAAWAGSVRRGRRPLPRGERTGEAL